MSQAAANVAYSSEIADSDIHLTPSAREKLLDFFGIWCRLHLCLCGFSFIYELIGREK